LISPSVALDPLDVEVVGGGQTSMRLHGAAAEQPVASA
jgi:hypothetical protein